MMKPDENEEAIVELIRKWWPLRHEYADVPRALQILVRDLREARSAGGEETSE